MWSSSRLLLPALLLLLSACGFQLRAAPELPAAMARTYIETANRHSLLYRDLRRAFEAAGVNVVDDIEDSQAVFTIHADETDQRVLSVSARNVPTEYEVYYTVRYSVQAGADVLLGQQQQTATRDYTYDATRVLGKAREEELLREALVDDLVRVIFIQLAAVR